MMNGIWGCDFSAYHTDIYGVWCDGRVVAVSVGCICLGICTYKSGSCWWNERDVHRGLLVAYERTRLQQPTARPLGFTLTDHSQIKSSTGAGTLVGVTFCVPIPILVVVKEFFHQFG